MGCPKYPAYNDVQNWAKGIGLDALWGTGYAATHCGLPASLADFQAFQHQAYAWATSGIGLVVEYYLGYCQSHGNPPDNLPDFQKYLTVIVPDPKTLNTVKPLAPVGYPPGSPTSFTQGYTGPVYVQQPDGSWVPSTDAVTNPPVNGNPAPGSTGSASGAATGIMSLIQQHPLLVAGGAVAGILLLVKR